MRLAVVVVTTLALGALAYPCITLASKGFGPVAVASETALIVWDPATKTEHFIRSATFQGNGKPMGFLVPTPTPPRLSQVGKHYPWEIANSNLALQIAPRQKFERKRVYRLTEDWDFEVPPRAASVTKGILTAGLLMPAGVEVISQEKIGNYQTAVLRADDTTALLGWLKRNGFESDARLTEWLDPYVDKGWAITAFRFASTTPKFSSTPIRLSFKTDRPFYPYREPKDGNAPASRSLRVFFVSPERVTGQLDTGAWTTKAEAAAPFASRAVKSVAGSLDLPENLFQGQWMTSFLDKTPARPASELYFDRDADQSSFGPPPVTVEVEEPMFIPKGLAALVVGFVGVNLGFAVWFHKRKKRLSTRFLPNKGLS